MCECHACGVEDGDDDVGDDQGHGRWAARTEAQLRRQAPPTERAQNRGTATARMAEVVSEYEWVGDCDDDDPTNDTDGGW
jgi:hypothetical protein